MKILPSVGRRAEPLVNWFGRQTNLWVGTALQETRTARAEPVRGV
ncbi:hypothetical protein [Georgenia yuyongxinii]